MKKKQSTVERYASVFESPAERTARKDDETDEWAGEDIALQCRLCETTEAHLHGSVLYQGGIVRF